MFLKLTYVEDGYGLSLTFHAPVYARMPMAPRPSVCARLYVLLIKGLFSLRANFKSFDRHCLFSFWHVGRPGRSNLNIGQA